MGNINHRKIVYLGFKNSDRDDGTKRRSIKTNQKMMIFKEKIKSDLVRELKEMKRNNCCMIASSELASSRLISVENIGLLIKELKGIGFTNILLVLFRRHPSSIMESRYSTAVVSEGWDKFQPPREGTDKADLFCDQVKLIKNWRSVIMDDHNIELKVYRYQNVSEKGIGEMLARKLGMNVSETKDSYTTNRSHSKVTLWIIVVLNKLTKSTKVSKNRLLMTFIEKARVNILKIQGMGKYAASKEYIRRIDNYYYESRIEVDI